MGPMRHLLLFGRRARAGRVKTRLLPLLGVDRTLALYRAWLADQLAFVRSFEPGASVEWWADGDLDPALDAGLPVRDLTLRLQGSGDLGERLAVALTASARAGAAATVVVGADSPTLPAATVDHAFERLERGAEAVLAPAEDGGYVLLGMRGPRLELLRGIPWGGADVAEATRAAARTAGLSLAEVEGWFDVDDAAGLARLVADLERPAAARRAPETRRVLLDSAFRDVI